MRDRTPWAQHVAGGSHCHAIDACGDWMAFGSRAGSVVVWNARLGVRQALQCRVRVRGRGWTDGVTSPSM